jgi:hypothetical protein
LGNNKPTWPKLGSKTRKLRYKKLGYRGPCSHSQKHWERIPEYEIQAKNKSIQKFNKKIRKAVIKLKTWKIKSGSLDLEGCPYSDKYWW